MNQKSEKEYMAEDDCRTLMRAKEIKADKARHKEAMKYAKKKYTELSEIMEEKHG